MSPPINQHPVFTVRMTFLLPTNSVKALKGKISHSMDLLTPSSPGGLPTLSLTTNSSWLPWVRVAMPLISPLITVCQMISILVKQKFTTAPAYLHSDDNAKEKYIRTFPQKWPVKHCMSEVQGGKTVNISHFTMMLIQVRQHWSDLLPAPLKLQPFPGQMS